METKRPTLSQAVAYHLLHGIAAGVIDQRGSEEEALRVARSHRTSCLEMAERLLLAPELSPGTPGFEARAMATARLLSGAITGSQRHGSTPEVALRNAWRQQERMMVAASNLVAAPPSPEEVPGDASLVQQVSAMLMGKLVNGLVSTGIPLEGAILTASRARDNCQARANNLMQDASMPVDPAQRREWVFSLATVVGGVVEGVMLRGQGVEEALSHGTRHLEKCTRLARERATTRPGMSALLREREARRRLVASQPSPGRLGLG